MKNVLIIDMGRPSKELCAEHGSYSDWFLKAFEPFNLSVNFETVYVPETNRSLLHAADAVILTGAHEGVYDELPWRDHFDPLLLKYIETGKQVLGVCFSHQYLCELMGGNVENRPARAEEGNIAVNFTDEGMKDPLFNGLGWQENFIFSHSDMIVKPGPGAVLLAHNDRVPYQAFRYGTNVRTLQFHPEMSPGISRSIIMQSDTTDLDKVQWLEGLNEPHSGTIVLQNFIVLANKPCH